MLNINIDKEKLEKLLKRYENALFEYTQNRTWKSRFRLWWCRVLSRRESRKIEQEIKKQLRTLKKNG